MKASELVANAWYLSGIVARDLETVSGSQATDGLRLLNDLLSEKRITGRLIPYFTQTSFNAVVGQESYFVNDLIETEDVT
ncbi:MAG: hypothetical protein GWN62_34815, partial [Aliifodinibius sp.]|nr:hypothetical protein [Fodinibius sp.]